MKFLCDQMLGTLAKWLRIMGYDAAYAEKGNDNEIIELAEREDRVLLTRYRELSSRHKNSLLIDGTELEYQIKKVVNSLGIDIDRKNYLSRCTVCNIPVKKISKEYAKGKVPSHAYESHDEFWICPNCKRIYWKGTHYENMKQFIERLGL